MTRFLCFQTPSTMDLRQLLNQIVKTFIFAHPFTRVIVFVEPRVSSQHHCMHSLPTLEVPDLNHNLVFAAVFYQQGFIEAWNLNPTFNRAFFCK